MWKNNWDRISTEFKHRSDWVNAGVRNILTKNQLFNWPQKDEGRLDFKEIRNSIKKNYTENALKINKNVTAYSKKIEKLINGSKAGTLLSNMYSKRWGKSLIFGVGGALAFSLVGKITSFSSEPVIPKKYERGYDILEENLTDFGSPVNLLKAATRSTIVPYYSSVRKGVITSTRTIQEKNLALFLNKNAIRHTRY